MTNRIESLNVRFRKQSGGAGISSMSSCPVRSSKAHRLRNPAPRRFVAEDSIIARDGLVESEGKKNCPMRYQRGPFHRDSNEPCYGVVL